MTIKKNDFLFLLISVVLAGFSSIAIGNPDADFALYGVAGMLGIIMVLAIVLKPNLGANILIFVVFTNISHILTDNLGIAGVVSPLVAIVFGAIIIRNYYAGQLPKDRKKTAAIEVFLILYFIAMAVSYLVASDKGRALGNVIEMAKNVVIVYAILFALRELSAWKQALRVVILTTTFLCFLGVYQSVTGNYSQNFFGLARAESQGVFDDDDGGTIRLAGPVNDPNYWAQIVGAVIPLVVFYIINEPSIKLKLLGIGVLGAHVLVLLNTYSRGGYLVLIVVTLLTLFVYGRKINPIVIFAGFGLLVFMFPFLPASYVARFESLAILTPSSEGQVNVYQDGSLQGRASVMLSGIAMFADRPLFGVGTGNFQTNYKEYSEILGIEFEYGERDPHSLFIQVLAETGIFGAISFLGIVILLLSRMTRAVRSIQHLPIYKSYAPWVMSLQVSMTAYLTASFFLHDAYIRYFWVLAALSITAIQLIDEHVKSVGQPKFTEFSH